ncbi:hypothetical protein FRACYDRAFT_235387 [Fragilariopsis cylindrus CCMP1102]|uniref:Uncharacterized protein n=1 Tax=Fragilariopsis cylindrus CCMP1102 TaxID=635003 RepID=A0A1E7FMF0_9STRA|nr:hypothetical protein FRACYDRAFT_235387 [Fragilariopsis cylindrus CCMP1102]|eukprot:OEU19340.1 hypothetical protein FRACYDRAFT_235387 [Fragilariopsis cylindrus CCMP1102]
MGSSSSSSGVVGRRGGSSWNISYRLFGPTTVHLRHEFYLLISLSMLGYAAIGRDIRYTILISVWLSRNLWIRYLLISCDTYTCVSERTIPGILSPGKFQFNPIENIIDFICTFVLAGQIFDRPKSHIGTVNGFTRYFSWIYGDITYLLRDVEYFFYGTAPASHYNPTKEHNLNSNSGNVVHSPFVTDHALQMEAMKYSTAVGYSGGYLHDTTPPFGLYERSSPPSWIECFYYIMIPATVLGIFCFGRVILLPIPDLVSGSSNIVKSLRTASKKQASSSVLSGVADSGGNKSSHRNSSSKGGGVVVEEMGEKYRDQPWLEQYQSIITDHRFKLICKVALIRLMENVFICAILPRTEFACKTTGQCATKSGLLELSKVMFFAGITSPLRSDYQDGSSGGTGEKPFSVGDNLLRPDTVSAYMIGISVVVTTLSLLLAQAATLNRSHLGITGYLAGGWIAIDDDDDYMLNNKDNKHSSSSDNNNNTSSSKSNKSSSTLQHLQQQQKEQQTSEWEPRKRYKKGDVIKYGRTMYRATTNNPEGVPFDLFLRATYKLFRNELGHPATSRIVAFVSTVQFGLISCLIILILIYQLLLEFDDTLISLLWTLAANLIAVYGTVSVAVPNYNEFDEIARSIFD